MTEGQKKIFSLVGAAVLTLIIVGIWFSFGNNSDDQVVAGEENKLSSVSPMQVSKAEFSKAFSSFNNDLPDLESTSTDIISSSTLITDGQAIPIEIIEATSTASSSEEKTPE